MKDKVYDVIIIGSGPAGLTAAIYTSRGGLKTLVLAGNQPGGQPTITDVVENFPGFPQGIKGVELMARVEKQAKKFGAEIVFESVESFRRQDNFEIETKGGKKYLSKAIIIASGGSPKWLDVPGSEKFRGKGISVCATCDAPFYKNKVVALVGGGDTALKEAVFLTKFASQVFIIHRRESLRGEKILQDRVKNNQKVAILYNSEVKEFIGDNNLSQIKVKTKYQVNSNKRESAVKTNAEKFGEPIDKDKKMTTWQLPIDGVFLAVGYTPNTEFLKGILELNDQGYIVTNQDVFTSIDGVFAAGDCVDNRYRQNIVACGMGCKAALEADKFINEPT